MSEDNKLVVEQAEPTANSEKAVWDLVIKDMTARDQEGLRKYKTRLQPFNGRNALVDAYQESLDQTVYLRQSIEEKAEMIAVLKFYADPRNWSLEGECHPNDHGDQARALLKKLGEG